MLRVSRREFGVLLLCTLFTYSCALKRFGSQGTTLHISNDPADQNHKFNSVINDDIESEENQSNQFHGRVKRDAPTNTNSTIQPSINYLNDTHQQLMVHWVGEGSNVIICLARDPPSRTFGVPPPSNIFISYDYGTKFVNKTESFKLGNGSYAQLDKFSNHPKYTSHCVFLDSRNKVLFYTPDDLKTVIRTDLDFHPSEVSFDDAYPDKFVVLDKLSKSRQLYLTLDGGKSFALIQEYVKTFFWSSTPPRMFYYERYEPNASSVILNASDPEDIHHSKSVLTNVQDFQIKGDFMFATRKSKEKTMDLLISFKKGKFHKAVFQTELDLQQFYISDVSNDRIFVAAMHTEKLTNLYVSEINTDFDDFKFVLSLEGIMCYMPNNTWKDSVLDAVADEAFIDLYKVEGLKGIYIASKVEKVPNLSNLGPEHLISVITYDYGSTWNPINPPQEDENGMPIVCLQKNNCSLHLSQKFSQLYPVTSKYEVNRYRRSASIMTSKSAPGIILATGVVGKSMKGIVGVYLSRDAGLTWKRILKDYYFFNFGDHGGVLTAVKYFKTRGETRKLLYSVDEGETWDAFEFHAEDLRVYGLMTEPGENTTTFTMFGSMKGMHQWIIIKVDLLKAFPRNCSEDDYKFWSPSSANTDSRVPCILGETDTYQRRKPKAQCYNGLNYSRPVKKQVCQCSRHDFECDYGFVPSGLPPQCIRNDSHSLYDPYKIPANCSPGQYYNRTKGYRKIDGDVCVDGYASHYVPDHVPCPMSEDTEFLIIALRDKIFRINLENNSTSIFPINGLKNVVAIEFDMKNNCIYWADIESDKIERQCLNSPLYPEVIVGTNLASIEGMALDWISNVLFFVDGFHAKIEAVRTDLTSQGRMRRTILGPDVLIKPRGIAVHPKAGYLYWSDWSPEHPSISRSNLDGSDIKKLFTKPIVQWPNGITIDRIAERIYWVDAMEDYIGSADLNGMYFKKVLSNMDTVAHPFAVAILKDKMYWDDWRSNSLYEADKDRAINIKTIKKNLAGLMDLKVFAHYVQQGTNACTYANNTCETLCLGAPMNNYSCLCPDGLTMKENKCLCPSGATPFANMTCPRQPNGCPVEQFTCGNGVCVPAMWRCDVDDDCGDGSDEVGCGAAALRCDAPLVPCRASNRCLPAHWRCDSDIDCMDGSDELGCENSTCLPGYFKCGDGHCINKGWVCDGEKDCHDGSDEKDCKHTTVKPKQSQGDCSSDSIKCVSEGKCIPKAWACDGERDCLDNTDEDPAFCRDNECASFMFRCTESGKCIYRSWVCDGEDDCVDGKASDEQNCTITPKPNTLPDPSTSPISFPATNQCLDWMFNCSNGKCVPYWWKCDGVNDCADGSDEIGCAVLIDTSTEKAGQTTEKPCLGNQFTCSPGICVSLSWVCDYAEDCPNGADEMNCNYNERRRPTKYHCKADMFACSDEIQCVPDSKVCDGHKDCNDGSDETSCGLIKKEDPPCPPGHHGCDLGQCIDPYLLCNGHYDCVDTTDEVNCTGRGTQQMYEIMQLGVDQRSINSTSFLFFWWVPQTKGVHFQFLPAISNASSGEPGWRNATGWIDDSGHKFTNLQPYTDYNVTVFIRANNNGKKYSYPSHKFLNVTTGEGVPSPPMNVIARQLPGRAMEVQWDPPSRPNGVITHYTVRYTPPVPPLEITTTGTLVRVEGDFRVQETYSFWVIAENSAYQSSSSEVSVLTYDGVGDVDNINNVTVISSNKTSVTLQWHKIRGIDGYIVRLRMPKPYAQPEPIKTKACNVTLTDLSPGVKFHIELLAYKLNLTGKPFTIPYETAGKPIPPLPSVHAVLVKDRGTAVQMGWSAVTEDDRFAGKPVQYEVHYDVTMESLFRAPKLVTDKTSAIIEGLNACESYIFSVAIKGGPLWKPPIPVLTSYNELAPVKHLTAFVREDSRKMTLMWRSSCEAALLKVGYMIVVTELTLGETSRYQLSGTFNASITHEFRNLPYGGRYNICVSTVTPGSKQNCIHVLGPRIPTPEHLYAWASPNGSVLVNWSHENKLADEGINSHYEVLISETEIPHDILDVSALDVQVFKTSGPPFAAPVIDAERSKNVAVRLVSDDGYMSDLSEVWPVSVEAAESQLPLSSSSITWARGAAVAAGVLALALAAALVNLALRHRRLHASFTRYAAAAAPRYDSRSGEARLGGGGLGDDDDSLPINGFADDEPLVIA